MTEQPHGDERSAPAGETQLLALTSAILLVTDSAGRVVSASAGAERRFPAVADETSDTRLSDLLEPADRHRVAALLADTRPDRVAESAARLVGDAGGPPVTLRVIGGSSSDRWFWEILESPASRESFVEQLDAALSRVRDLNALERVVMAALGHDLKGPVAGLRHLLDLLAQQGGRFVPPLWKRARDQMSENVAEIRRVLDDLGYLGEVSAGRFDPDPGPVDMADLVAGALDRADFGRRDLHVDLVAAPVVTDRGLAGRIVANLLQNAARHSPETASVWVEVAPTPSGALFVVADNGPGLPPWTYETLLPTEAEPPGRHGGLFIVSRFAAALGGGIRVEEREGGGVWIGVDLPDLGPAAAEDLGTRGGA